MARSKHGPPSRKPVSDLRPPGAPYHARTPHVDAPAGYIARDATLEDAAAISDLVNEVNVAEIGTRLTDVEDVRNDLTSPREYRDDTVLEATAAHWPDT